MTTSGTTGTAATSPTALVGRLRRLVQLQRVDGDPHKLRLLIQVGCGRSARRQQLSAQGVALGINYLVVAPTAFSAGTASKPNTVATCETAKRGLSDSIVAMPLLMHYGGEHISAGKLLWAFSAERCICPGTTLKSVRSNHG